MDIIHGIYLAKEGISLEIGRVYEIVAIGKKDVWYKERAQLKKRRVQLDSSGFITIHPRGYIGCNVIWLDIDSTFGNGRYLFRKGSQCSFAQVKLKEV